jgi:hypothetical protein
VSEKQTTYVFESLPMQFAAEKDSLVSRPTSTQPTNTTNLTSIGNPPPGGLETDVIDAAAGPVCLILAEAEPS